MKSKYTAETLSEIVPECQSVAEVLRKLGLRVAGGSQAHIKRLMAHHGINTSHFTGRALRPGSPTGGIRKLAADEVLVRNRSAAGSRERAARLRRALIETGVEPKCSACGCGETWNGRALRMQIDHRNGDALDNTAANLRFLCPNCHSQTENYGTLNRKRS